MAEDTAEPPSLPRRAAATWSLWLPGLVLAVAATAAYAAVVYNAVAHAPLTADETQYLVRGLWYENGTHRPYTPGDTAWRMPLYYELAGVWIDAVGPGAAGLRWLSAAFGLIAAALVFATVRRLTAHTLAAAAGAAVVLATPAAAYTFATATPAALVAALHALALWLIVSGLGRPRWWRAAAMGAVLAAMVLLSRDSLPIAVFVAPLFALAAGRDRLAQFAVVLAVAAGLAFAAMALYPARLRDIALWGPLLAPALDALGLAPRALIQIDVATVGASLLAPSWPRDGLAVLTDTLLLPFAGATLAALGLIALTGPALRVLWVVSAYGLWLALANGLALIGGCESCLIERTAVALPALALGAALALAMIGRWARGRALPAAPFVIGGALAIVAADTFGPALASRSAFQYFPAPALRASGSVDAATDLSRLGQMLIKETPAGERLLALHSTPALAYAVVMARRGLPPQSLDPDGTYRTISPAVTGARRETVLAALEGHGLWTRDTLLRWIGRDFDRLLIERGNAHAAQPDIAAAIAERFVESATVAFAGREVTLYTRAQP